MALQVELSTSTVTPAAAMRGPPTPRSAAPGSRRTISAASEAAAMSPETSPATMKMFLPLPTGLSHVHADNRNARPIGDRQRLDPVKQQCFPGLNGQDGGADLLEKSNGLCADGRQIKSWILIRSRGLDHDASGRQTPAPADGRVGPFGRLHSENHASLEHHGLVGIEA